MLKSSFTALFFFIFFSWIIAAINTNQWLPPDYSLIPENPRVLAGLLAVFLIMLATCFLIYIMERLIFNVASKLPRGLARWSYDGLFIAFSFIIIRFVWLKVSQTVIVSDVYRPYLANFYNLSGITQDQLSGILMATFFILILVSFFSMRRYVI
ncbi:MAG: hypothetical protein ABH919_03400 [bacterium]